MSRKDVEATIRAILPSREGLRDDEPVWSDKAVRSLLGSLDLERAAALAALDEWDAATKDWLAWFAEGGTGFHKFPTAARNHLRAVLTEEAT